jgi:hypothetical protein
VGQFARGGGAVPSYNLTNEDTFMLWAVSCLGGAGGSWGRLGRYINCPHLCCNFRRRFFVSLAFNVAYQGRLCVVVIVAMFIYVIKVFVSVILYDP